MSTLKPTFFSLFFALLLTGCAGVQLPGQLSEAPTATATLVPATPTPIPTPTEAVDTSPDESTAAPVLELTETHVFPDFGYSIDYPTDWVAGTKNNLTIISELEEDQERIFGLVQVRLTLSQCGGKHFVPIHEKKSSDHCKKCISNFPAF